MKSSKRTNIQAPEKFQTSIIIKLFTLIGSSSLGFLWSLALEIWSFAHFANR